MMALLRRLELVGNRVAVALKRGVINIETTIDATKAMAKTHNNSFRHFLKKRNVALWS